MVIHGPSQGWWVILFMTDGLSLLVTRAIGMLERCALLSKASAPSMAGAKGNNFTAMGWRTISS